MADCRNLMTQEVTLTYDLVVADANLYKTPRTIDLAPFTAVVLGDNHGNTLKLIYSLMWLKIIAKENYQDFFKNFKGFLKSQIDYTVLIGKFWELNEKINFTSKPHIIFLGDLFSDRVGNGILNFEIFHTLHQKHNNYKIVNSNHDVEMQFYIEKGEEIAVINREQTLSLRNMLKMLNVNVAVKDTKVNFDYVKSIYEKAYRPYIVPVAYTLSEDLNTIILYGHADVSIPLIESMYINAYAITSYLDSANLTPKFCADTPLELAKSIDRLNARYKQHAANKGLHAWYPISYFRNYSPDRLPENVMRDAPFYWGIWSRMMVERNPHPFKNPQQKAIYVLGHHRKKLPLPHVIELDNDCGKEIENDEEALPALRVIGIQDAANIFLPSTDEDRNKQFKQLKELILLYENTKEALTKLSQNPLAVTSLADIRKLSLATNDAQYENNKLLMESFKHLHRLLYRTIDLQAETVIGDYFFDGGQPFQYQEYTIDHTILNGKPDSNTFIQIALHILEINNNKQSLRP